MAIYAGAFGANVSAQEKHAGQSATITNTQIRTAADPRVTQLRAYLESRNSPLADYAEVFVREADRNNIDWKFVVAISGAESSFGLRIPANSYNGWGWGVYGDNVHRFTSWDDGITTISSELRSKYMTKWGARNIQEIGRIYAASPTWAAKVTYFMNQIDAYKEKSEIASLPISL